MARKTLLLTGSTGFLGLRLGPSLASRWRVVGASRTASGPDAVRMDLEDLDSVRRAFDAVRPDAVVHAGAMAKPDDCEREPERARRVNRDAARVLAEACGRAGARLIHLSTDLVFDGERGMYTEDDDPAPVNAYGRTKLEAEEAVLGAAPGAVVLRVATLYGRPLGAARCFVDELRAKLSRGEPAGAFEDQWRTSTAADFLHEPVLRLLDDPDLDGVYHWSGAERATRYELAVALCRTFGWDERLVRRTRMADARQAARRPRDSSLDSSRLAGLLGLAPVSLAAGFAALKAAAATDTMSR
ncbi:MAG: SDR family oxidoreductase [Elusimicrobia bacterium]|nr:SDR family oxidoreductase [Elusimicrobiota bacterium]